MGNTQGPDRRARGQSRAGRRPQEERLNAMKVDAPAVSHHRRHKRSQKKIWIVGSLAVGVPVAVASAWFWRGCEEYTMVVAYGSPGIGVPALLGAWIAHSLQKRTTRTVVKFLSVGCFALLQLIGLFGGK